MGTPTNGQLIVLDYCTRELGAQMDRLRTPSGRLSVADEVYDVAPTAPVVNAVYLGAHGPNCRAIRLLHNVKYRREIKNYRLTVLFSDTGKFVVATNLDGGHIVVAQTAYDMIEVVQQWCGCDLGRLRYGNGRPINFCDVLATRMEQAVRYSNRAKRCDLRRGQDSLARMRALRARTS